MSKLQGHFTKTIFHSENDYYVLIFRIKENDIDNKYNNKSVTVTGYFYDFDDALEYSLQGEFQHHTKYGEQFVVNSYQTLVPEDKNSIITFFTSGIFKGIGESKALKIYESLGDNALNLIKENPNVLNEIKGLTPTNRQVIIEKLKELDQSADTILNLTNLGFSVSDATLILKKYREKTISIINHDLYTLFYDLEKMPFNKIDRIALKNNILKNDERRIKAGIIQAMRTLALEKGDTYSLVDDIYELAFSILKIAISYDDFLNYLNELIKDLRIVQIKEEYQLIEYYEADNNIVKRLTYLNNKEDSVYKKNYLENKILEYQQKYQITYDEIQKEAIKEAFLKNFLIITGGPGTGKTTIIKSIVSMYIDIYNSKIKDLDEEIALLAPTGRASKRIMEAAGYKASTIHRFLKWNKDTNKFQVNEYNKSKVKLVIIDEVSMLDTILFSSLLNGLKYDTKIIIVGDKDQLPSVSPGDVLKDLIEAEIFKTINLKNLYRQKSGSNIINLAYDVNQGDVNYNLFNKDTDLLFYQATSQDIKDKLTIIMKDYSNLDYHDFQIMAPMYKTMNGIDNLNQMMQNLFNPKSYNKEEIVIYDVLYRVGDKVLQLVNMPDDNIYNGDIGIILEINNLTHEIVVDFDSNIVTFTRSTFGNFTLGYVISIHKSQGSEFQTVVMPILKEYDRMLYRKLIYTGITRCKQKLILIGDAKAFQKGILTSNRDTRKTNLKDKLKNRYQEV